MNQCIRDNWNSVVKPEDKVYHLGDVYLGKNWTGGEKIVDFLRSLNGKKRLILGNHDNGKDQNLLNSFQKITMWRDFKEFGVLLTHVPIHPHSLLRGGRDCINVHGHTHNNIVEDEVVPYKDRRYKNVCVEHTNYFPVNIEELNSNG